MSQKRIKPKAKKLSLFERMLPEFADELLKLDPEMKAIYTPGEGLSNVPPEVIQGITDLVERFYDKTHPKRFLEKWEEFEAHVAMDSSKTTFQMLFFMGGRIVVELVFQLMRVPNEGAMTALIKELGGWAQAHRDRKPGSPPRFEVNPEGPAGKRWMEFAETVGTTTPPGWMEANALVSYAHGCLAAYSLIRGFAEQGEEGLKAAKDLQQEIAMHGYRMAQGKGPG